ncbi:MAG TPA: PQQ-binding-like beta-propeller repeat protein, partial [Pirellulales bacterium]|nr:PQQ-binding-like beta-propeller repeat protein [Pirellulales bacterium]
MHCLVRSAKILTAAILLSAAGSSAAADWPQWRGPSRNGLGPKSPALANTITGLSPLWLSERIPSGDQGGRGSLLVRAGKVYGVASVSSSSTVTDEVFCLDAADGKSVWKVQLQETGVGQAGSSTPCIVNDRIYVVGSGSKVYCLAADTGKPIWEAKLARSGGEPIASSIAVAGKVAVLLADVLTGLDAETGELLWTQNKIAGRESSPAPWNASGHDYVICNGAKETHCVDAADGRIVWSVPGGGKSTPVVAQEYGGDFLVNLSDNRRSGLSAYRLTDKEPKKLWTLQKTDRGSSPVVFDGYVYVVAGGGNGHGAHLLSVHLDTGKVAWEEVVDFAEVSSPAVAD